MKVHLLTYKDENGVTFAERNYADISSDEAYEYGLQRAKQLTEKLKKQITFVGSEQIQ
jgi:hypothetical protein